MKGFKNILKLLNKLAGKLESVLKSTVKVKTGALRDSISVKVERNELIISMLKYGTEGEKFGGRSASAFIRGEIKKYTPKLAKAFKEDIQLTIKNK